MPGGAIFRSTHPHPHLHLQPTSKSSTSTPRNPQSTPTTHAAADAPANTMFGPFRITNPLSGGLLWKIPWRLSKFQKRRHRLRMRAVDSVVATVDSALSKKGETLEALERWKAEMPTEAEMLPRDKYTMFDRKAKRFRKGIHSMFLRRGFDRRTIGLIANRNTEVDEGQPEGQSSWLLSGESKRAVRTTYYAMRLVTWARLEALGKIQYA